MPFPLTKDQLRSTEQVFGLRFPQDYREAMQRKNGGEVSIDGEDWFLHPLKDESDRKRISRTANHVARETALAREWPGFPPDAASIAEDGSGNHLVFLPSSSDPGAFDATVYRWDHETGTLTGLNSFAAFEVGDNE